MNHLGRGNVKHPHIFESGLATHVVTGIQYGAQAFFVFEREVSEQENRQDIEGNLRVMIKKIPFLAIEGQGSLKMEDKDKTNVDKFSCRFLGDFSLPKTPTSFEEAIEVYQSLPGLLGPNGENAVPMKVWLLPLTTLDSAAAKIVRQISIRMVQEAQSVLQDFSELEMRCNDILKAPTAQHFPQVKDKIRKFREMCYEFKLEFQRTLATRLPLLRGGGEEEAVLAGILMQRHASPFNTKDLQQWVESKEREICTLKSLTSMMKETKIISSQGKLHEEIFSAGQALCFVFTSVGSNEPYLSSLSSYLRHKMPTPDGPTDKGGEQWHISRKVADATRHRAKLFSDFAEANKLNKNIAFLTVGLTDDKQEGSSIYYYKDSACISENFEPPSKPEAITVDDVNHDSVALAVSPPRFGAENLTSYHVEYCIRGKDGWQQTTAPLAKEVVVTGLPLNTDFLFRCRAVTSAGVGPAMEVNGPIKTLPCSPPGQPHTEPNSSEISVTWEKPAVVGQDVHILSYITEYAKEDNGAARQWSRVTSSTEKTVISGLDSETEYVIRVSCDCGFAGRSKESVSIAVRTKRREFDRVAEFVKHVSKRLNSQFPSLYKLPLSEEDLDIDGCRRYVFGKESRRQNRTIMLLGATGSGKSTLINGMVNYMTGVDWKDDFRFKLVHEDQSRSQAESQTSEVTVYKLNHQEGFKTPFHLTIVDTPGFGDTRGVTRDREITEQIRRLFTSANGVSEIDAVCFVTQAALVRLTATQRYVFDSVLSIFGKDVAENIKMLVTFADGKQPPVLDAINAAAVPCPKNEIGLPVHFKFNNSALFADNRSVHDRAGDSDEDDVNFDQMFWSMGAKSMERFFTALGKMTTKSLLMTQEVLKERKQLETAVEGLQPQVKIGLAKLQQMKSTREKIKEHETAMMSNENFEIEVDVMKPVQKQLTSKGEYITNCQRCSVTCHYPCAIADDNQKRGCASMDGAGLCRVCPGKCVWSVHFNQTYRWEYVPSTEKQTLKEFKDKYENASKDKLTIEGLMERQEEEIDLLQDTIVSLMDQTSQCITRLQEIALRPNPLTTPEYIDMLIEGESSEAKPGYQARIQALEMMKERATIISKVANRDKLSKTDEELSEEKEKRKEKQSFFKKVTGFLGF